MTDDGTAQSFFNYITVCLTTPDLYNKYFRHAYESFLYSNPRVRFVYMQFLIYFQEGWKFGPRGSSSWVISLILHISCVFFFRRAQFTFNLCSALCIFLVKFWFELSYGQLGWRQEELSLARCISCCQFAHGGRSLVFAITKNRCPSFQTQIYSCPTQICFMSCCCCTPCRWICVGRSVIKSSGSVVCLNFALL